MFYGRLISVTIISRTDLIVRGRDDDRLIVSMRRYIKYLFDKIRDKIILDNNKTSKKR